MTSESTSRARAPVAGFAAALAAAVGAPAQEPDARERCVAAVLPAEGDLQWRAIPWRTALRAAALEADGGDRPVLLWAMNGHPLGCT